MSTPDNDNPTPQTPPAAAPADADDLRAQVAALIALAVSERREAPRKGQSAGSIGWIAAVTALLAALGSALGASQSLYSSTQASKIQQDIMDRQEKLDVNDRRGGENSRIGNLFTFYGESCAGIPLDEIDKWDKYDRCVFQTKPGQPPGDYRLIPDNVRLACLKQGEVNMCGRRPLPSTQPSPAGAATATPAQ